MLVTAASESVGWVTAAYAEIGAASSAAVARVAATVLVIREVMPQPNRPTRPTTMVLTPERKVGFPLPGQIESRCDRQQIGRTA